MSVLRSIWKNTHFKTLITIILIIATGLTLIFGVQFALHTSQPVLTVVSGSMSIPYDWRESASWEGFWLSITHPFDRTLSVGDLIIIQGVNPKDLNINYPNSDIIVFHRPDNPSELIVHRIIGENVVNGTVYFLTKGDGNGNPWPQTPQSGQDPWDFYNPPGVAENLVVGKVVMRIPWLGWLAIVTRDNQLGLSVIIAIILILVMLELVISEMRKKMHHEEKYLFPQGK